MTANVLINIFAVIAVWSMLRLLGGEHERGVRRMEDEISRAAAAAKAAAPPAPLPAASNVAPTAKPAAAPAAPKAVASKAVR